MTYLSRPELAKLGFSSFGKDVLVSDKCSIYGAERIRLGDHVRIDDFTVITAGEAVSLGSYVIIGPHVFLSGTHGLEIADFATIASGVKVYTVSNDYSGRVLASYGVPDELLQVEAGQVRIGRHSIIGAQSVVLPGVTLEEGVAVGALSLVKRSLDAWSIYAGVPARYIGPRSREMLDQAADFLHAHSRMKSDG